MRVNKFKIVALFRYFWLMVAVIIIGYVLNKSIVTERLLIHNLDFSQSISADITGWYPESRALFDHNTEQLVVLGEPIYLQFYLPVKFDTLTIKGSINFDVQPRLGLRQADNSWLFRDIMEQDLAIDFSLAEAQIKNSKVDLILSIPDLSPTSSVRLDNNWQLFLSR